MPAKKRLAVIVEGDGDALAVPAIVQRWFARVGLLGRWVTDDLAINTHGVGRLTCAPDAASRQRGIEYFVGLARARGPGAILVVLDADDECARRERERRPSLSAELVERARRAVETPVGVVVADRAFEAWLLNHAEALRAAGRCEGRWAATRAIESMSSKLCKEAVLALLQRPCGESTDQVVLAKALPVPARDEIAVVEPRSYRKLFRELERLVSLGEGGADAW